ncbi:Acg family FMN-binding oxidoreductase [Pseudonocardia sp.]|uniref:Acg family FMN-binding oxidoreductase n=1 Tax=Pseudonocardia sp. TaxID=60912 RepID=UPI003D0E1C2E
MSATSSGVDVHTLEGAVRRATRAPSVHNTQPWRWRVAPGRIDLHADPDRRLVATDPDGRDLLVSCGAALEYLRVALAGVGAGSRTTRFPDADDRYHLATVTVRAGHAALDDANLYAQLDRRHSDRRPYDAGIPAQLVRTLARRARTFGAELVAVDGRAREALVRALDDAATGQPYRPGYLAELLVWTHRYAGARDGVPCTAVPKAGPDHDAGHLNRFPAGTLAHRTALEPDAGTLCVLTTAADDRTDRLRAGEAAAAVLLAATAAGYATCPLSQALELEATRARVQVAAGAIGHPQLLIRIGRPAEYSGPVPETPRRAVSNVLF